MTPARVVLLIFAGAAGGTLLALCQPPAYAADLTPQVCSPAHARHPGHHRHAFQNKKARQANIAVHEPAMPTTEHPGYANQPPDWTTRVNVTGRNGSPRYRAADQQRSFIMSCGLVYHRFFDQYGAALDRPIRVCN